MIKLTRLACGLALGVTAHADVYETFGELTGGELPVAGRLSARQFHTLVCRPEKLYLTQPVLKSAHMHTGRGCAAESSATRSAPAPGPCGSALPACQGNRLFPQARNSLFRQSQGTSRAVNFVRSVTCGFFGAAGRAIHWGHRLAIGH